LHSAEERLKIHGQNDHYESIVAKYAQAEFRVKQLETALKIIALKNGGRYMWEIAEIENAVAEKRVVTLGGFGIELVEI
jgi:hypothetical protein